MAVPFPEVESVPPPVPVTLKFRGYASLYREALTTLTPAYAFLCLYRILEGLVRDRAQRAREAKRQGGDKPFCRAWKVPSTKSQFGPWLNALYRLKMAWDVDRIDQLFPEEAKGKKITKVKDDFLEPLRNRIAHSIFGDTGRDYWEESLEYLNEVQKWLPLTQMIARRMLHAMKESVNLNVWRALSSRAGGEVLHGDDF